MFDIGWDELLLIGVIALIVIGPKDLPMAMRALARMINRARGLNREFQNSLAEVMREAELDEMRRKFEAAAKFDVGRSLKEAVDPTGVIDRAFDPAGPATPAAPPGNVAPPGNAAPPDKAAGGAAPPLATPPGNVAPPGNAAPPPPSPAAARADEAPPPSGQEGERR